MSDQNPEMQGLVCPLPLPHDEMVVMGHGSGGKLMHNLIARHFLPHFANPILQAGDDAGLIVFAAGQADPLRLAFSTDSHVVWPLFFPGGDIGRLAVCGTVNDIAMLGAQPLYLSAGFILEEGLEIRLLERVLDSMQAAAEEAGVQIVTGDTKVVQRGKADGLYINTSGVGRLFPQAQIGGALAQPGDVVLLSGTIGDHGIAVLEARGELGFASQIASDVAPLNTMVAELIQANCRVHVLRDPTRGGLATTLNEIAGQSNAAIVLEESKIPIKPAVNAACEMLGFDSLYVANEGKLVVIVHPDDADRALDLLRSNRYGRDAACIGQVLAEPRSRVLMKTVIGATRVVDNLSGELLPRIC
jgi:hydrogenase expression/formation protein HypE